MPASLARIEEWMYSTLAGDATITSIVGSRIYADEAPQGAAFPLVLFAHIGNVDVFNSLGSGRVTKSIFLVRAVGRGTSTNGSLKTVADRFDPLLLTHDVTIDGVLINTVVHFQDHIRKDSEDGVPMSYLGTYYYIFCQPI